jgi:glycosyltransferase involved in cell wall biosynthesis
VATTDLVYWERLGGALSYWLDFLFFAVRMWIEQRARLREVDIIYVREPYLTVFLPRAKTILELHTLPAQTIVMKRILRRVKRLNAISRGLASDVVAFSGRSDITVIPDAVDLKRFDNLPDQRSARAQLGLPDKPLVLYTGNFYPWKGVDTLADAAFFLKDITVVLVGGTDEYDYQRIAKKAESAPNLIVRRFEAPERMPIYLAAADVLVIPNAKSTAISERYTSPLKLFEYMAAEKPIVASDLPSLREILDEDTAIFFEPDSVQSLASAIRRALKPEAALLGTRAHERARVYSWEARAQAAIGNL